MKTITIIKLGFDCFIGLFLIFTYFSSIYLIETHGYTLDAYDVQYPFNETWDFGFLRVPFPNSIFFFAFYAFFYYLSSIIFLIGVIIQLVFYVKEYYKFFAIVSISMIIFGVLGMNVIPAIALAYASSGVSYYGTFNYEIVTIQGSILIDVILFGIILKYIIIGLMRYFTRKKLLKSNERGLEQYLKSNP